MTSLNHPSRTGQRIYTAGMLETADRYGTLPEDCPTASRGQALAAFKAAARALGIKPRLVALIDELCTYTYSVDWTPQGKLLVWPANGRLQDALQIGASQLAVLIRRAGEAGLLVMRDGKRGQRHGQRIDGDRRKPVEWAYGFDLTPLQVRHDEFRRVAAAHRARLDAAAKLRREITANREEVIRLCDFALRDAAEGMDWKQAAADALALWLSRGRSRELELLMPIAARLESLLARVHQALRLSKTGPTDAENRTHLPITNPSLSASDEERTERLTPPALHEGSSRGFSTKTAARVDRESGQGVTREFEVRPWFVVAMAPEFGQILEIKGVRRPPGWPELWDAADSVRISLGISPHLWTRACNRVSVTDAIILLAVVAHTKMLGRIYNNPGAYFDALLKNHLAGTLRLDGTLHGIKKRLKEQVKT